MLEQQLFNEVLKLPPLVRASFAERILASIKEDSPVLFLDEWLVEIDNRIKEYKTGQVQMRSEDEVFAKYHLK